MDIFNNLWSIIKTIQFRDVIDILAIALIVFGLFRAALKGRAAAAGRLHSFVCFQFNDAVHAAARVF